MYVKLAGNYFAALITIEHCFNQKSQLFAWSVECQEMHTAGSDHELHKAVISL